METAKMSNIPTSTQHPMAHAKVSTLPQRQMVGLACPPMPHIHTDHYHGVVAVDGFGLSLLSIATEHRHSEIPNCITSTGQDPSGAKAFGIPVKERKKVHVAFLVLGKRKLKT